MIIIYNNIFLLYLKKFMERRKWQPTSGNIRGTIEKFPRRGERGAIIWLPSIASAINNSRSLKHVLIKACWERAGPQICLRQGGFVTWAQAFSRHSRFRREAGTLSASFRNPFPNPTGSKTYTRALTYLSPLRVWLTVRLAAFVSLWFSHPPTFASLRKKRTRTRLANVPREAISKDSRRFSPLLLRFSFSSPKRRSKEVFFTIFSIFIILVFF